MFEFLLIIAGIFVVSVIVISVREESKRDKDAKSHKEKMEEADKELARYKIELEHEREREQLRKEQKAEAERRELEELLAKVDCYFKVYGHTDGAAVMEWEVVKNPANVTYQVKILRTRNRALADDMHHKGEVVLTSSEAKGNFRDPTTRLKGGDYYFTIFLIYEDVVRFTQQKLITVDAEMHRKMDYMKKEGKYREATADFIKKTGDLYKAQTGALRDFQEMAVEEMSAKEIGEEAGIEPILPRVKGVVRKTRLDQHKKDALTQDIEKTTKQIEEQVENKSEAEEKLIVHLVRLKTKFSDEDDRFNAYQLVMNEFGAKEYVSKFGINLADLLRQVDEHAYSSLYGQGSEQINYDLLE